MRFLYFSRGPAVSVISIRKKKGEKVHCLSPSEKGGERKTFEEKPYPGIGYGGDAVEGGGYILLFF